MKKTAVALFFGLIVLGGQQACLQHYDGKSLDPQKAHKVALQAYMYGYPLVLMDLTCQTHSRRLPMNQFYHARAFPTAESRSVVRPNVDTLYSSAWLDLSHGPIVMSVPDTHDRYYLVQMLDAWTETFAVPGARTTGKKAGQFAIVGPEWTGNIPPQMTAIRAPTNLVWLLGRIQTNGRSDYPNVHALQRGFRLEPLTSTGSHFFSPSASSTHSADEDMPPPKRIARMDAPTFFTRFAEAMKKNPPHTDDKLFIKPFSSIGLVPGKSFDYAGLDAGTKRSLDRAVVDAQHQLSRVNAAARKGWTFSTNIGRYGTNYVSRAIVARVGLGALPAEDAIYLSTKGDSYERRLNGANAYVVHFAKYAMPPVNAFWSLSLYDAEGYFVANALNRYALGDRDDLRFNEDGSLDIYVQRKRPSEEQVQNWLPAPDGAFNLSLRLYWPRQEVIARQWTPPEVRRLP